MNDDPTGGKTSPPILSHKYYDDVSAFTPESLLREARRQKRFQNASVPDVCILDPDGDIVRHLRATGRAQRDPNWACYHTELYVFRIEERQYGIIGCAVGASFAVLIAEEMFASGCRLLISITSAGQIVPVHAPPYFVLVDRALRDEGTSYHYLPASDYSEAEAPLIRRVAATLLADGARVHVGAAWTTDALFAKQKRRSGRQLSREFSRSRWKRRLCTHLRRRETSPCCVSPMSRTRWVAWTVISKKASRTERRSRCG